MRALHVPLTTNGGVAFSVAGEPVDMEKPKQLLALYDKWIDAKSPEVKIEAWREILEIHAEEGYTIGLVGEVPAVMLVKNGFRNFVEDMPYGDTTGGWTFLNAEQYTWEDPATQSE